MGVTIPGPSGEVKESYEISNSLRFNDAEDTKLDRPGISGTLSKAHTFSVWIKRDRTKPSGRHTIAGMGDGSGDISWLMFNNDSLIYYATGSGTYALTTTAKYRDLSAWYHVVAKVDTTQSTASDRFKFYVNGVEQAFTGTILPQNHQANMDAQIVAFNSSDVMDGYMSEFHFLDGVAYDPTYFGEFDSNGVWVPIEYTGGNYGTFGFYLEFKQTGTSQNSSGMGADTSGNDNHFAVTNLTAQDVTTDTPTNNFATMNPLDNYYAGATFSEGNCKIVTGSSPTTFVTSTLGVETGKWYWEVKIIDKAGGSDDTSIGVQGGVSPGATDQMGYNTAGVQLRSNGNKHTNGSNATYMAAQDNNDIIMVAFDKTNNNVYFGANGQWGDGSGNTDESNPTSAISITITAGDFVFAALGDMDGSDTCTYEINFGNPSFAISSGNADANGYGNFEYAPPSGYYALCTKNLAEFG